VVSTTRNGTAPDKIRRGRRSAVRVAGITRRIDCAASGPAAPMIE
jgi:hypothetical protein